MNAPSTDKSSAAKPTARAAAEKALETTRDTAREAARRTAEGIEANPLAVLIGGVASATPCP